MVAITINLIITVLVLFAYLEARKAYKQFNEKSEELDGLLEQLINDLNLVGEITGDDTYELDDRGAK